VCVAKRLLKEYDAAQVANLIVRPQRRYVEKYSQPLNVTDVTDVTLVASNGGELDPDDWSCNTEPQEVEASMAASDKRD
jgi:hypothetical protein